MLYRPLWRSGLLISVFVLGLATSTVNFAAPKASKESLDPRFRNLPPELRERLEKRMRARPQTKAAPTGRIPIKPPPTWIQQLGTPENDVATAVAVGPRDNIYVTGSTEGTLGDQSYGRSDAWLAKYGPSRKLLWKVQLGSSDDDYSDAVAVDREGNVYITGYTFGKLGDRKYEASDAWVAKYSASGKLQWTKQLGTPNYDYSFGVATDSNGNVYLTGSTGGKLGDQSYGGRRDAWVAKYSPSGKLQWTKQLGTPKSERSSGIATDSNGNVYLTGSTGGKLGDKEYDTYYFDAWVAKYDSSGTQLWVKQLGTPDNDYSYGVATDSNGNVYLTGETDGKLGDKDYDGTYYPDAPDAWVAKYDSSGTQLWVKQLGTPDDDYSYGVATDSNGNVYLTGETDGKLGDKEYGYYDAWVAKYSPSGKLQWTKQLGTPDYDYSDGVATDSNGNVYLTGFTKGKLGDQSYGGFRDAWVAKYKP